jgi:plastocyanin
MMRALNVGLIALTLGVAGCAQDEPTVQDGAEPAAQEPAAGATVEFTTVEYEFQGIPSELQAGETTFALTNDGQEQHEFSLFRMTGDQPVDELIQLPEKQARKLIEDVTHTFAKPGGSAEATADLTPGRYGYVCFIPAPDGEPHALKGMNGEFSVA